MNMEKGVIQREIPTFKEGLKKMLYELGKIYFSKKYLESLIAPKATTIDVDHMQEESDLFFSIDDDEIEHGIINRYYNLSEIRFTFLMHNFITLKTQIMMKNKAIPFPELTFGSMDDYTVQGKVMPGDIIFVRGDTRKGGTSLRDLLYVTPVRQLIANANGFHFAFSHVMFHLGNGAFVHYIGGKGLEIVHMKDFGTKLLPYYVVAGPRYPVEDRRKRMFPIINDRRTPGRTREEDLKIIRRNEIITTDRSQLARTIKHITRGDYDYPHYGYEKLVANYFNHVFGHYILTRKRGIVKYHKKKKSLHGWAKLRYILGYRYLNDDPERPICATAVASFMKESGLYSIKKYFDQNKMAGTGEILFLMCDFDSIQIRAAYMPDSARNIV
ncbi:MAG: hypothetical protein HQM12_08585 [SAR324 cluster bacterium]|nr:hypothetical protein [SAR324 cluster bacterium]